MYIEWRPESAENESESVPTLCQRCTDISVAVMADEASILFVRVRHLFRRHNALIIWPFGEGLQSQRQSIQCRATPRSVQWTASSHFEEGTITICARRRPAHVYDANRTGNDANLGYQWPFGTDVHS